MTRTYTLADFEEVVGEMPADHEETSGAFSVPPQMSQGERHSMLFKMCRSCKARGHSLEATLKLCHEENRQKCNPPVDEAELDVYLRR